MEIVESGVKIGMLQAVVDSIYSSAAQENNKVVFLDSEDNILAKMEFVLAVVNSGNTALPKIDLLSVDGANLEAMVIKSGTVSVFKIYNHLDDSKESLRGTVGTIQTLADIRFNRTTWTARTGISLQDITIKLENVCLHQ